MNVPVSNAPALQVQGFGKPCGSLKALDAVTVDVAGVAGVGDAGT